MGIKVNNVSKEQEDLILRRFRHDGSGNLIALESYGGPHKSQIKKGEVCGSTYRGYIRVYILGHSMQAHRVIWFLEKGEWPKGVLDHIDGDGTNNNLENLRDVDIKNNQRAYNKPRVGTSEFRGVYKKKNRWVSSIRVDGTIKDYKSHLCEKEAALDWNYSAVKFGYLPESYNEVFL